MGPRSFEHEKERSSPGQMGGRISLARFNGAAFI